MDKLLYHNSLITILVWLHCLFILISSILSSIFCMDIVHIYSHPLLILESYLYHTIIPTTNPLDQIE